MCVRRSLHFLPNTHPAHYFHPLQGMLRRELSSLLAMVFPIRKLEKSQVIARTHKSRRDTKLSYACSGREQLLPVLAGGTGNCDSDVVLVERRTGAWCSSGDQQMESASGKYREVEGCGQMRLLEWGVPEVEGFCVP